MRHSRFLRDRCESFTRLNCDYISMKILSFNNNPDQTKITSRFWNNFFIFFFTLPIKNVANILYQFILSMIKLYKLNKIHIHILINYNIYIITHEIMCVIKYMKNFMNYLETQYILLLIIIILHPFSIYFKNFYRIFKILDQKYKQIIS